MSNNPSNSDQPTTGLTSPASQPQGIPLGQMINEQVKKPIAQSDLKKAAKQVLANPGKKAEPPKRPEPQPKAPKTPQKMNMKAVYVLAILLVLLIPLPKQIGGDIEIEGTPSSNQAFIRPSIPGTIKEILVKTGQEVRTGQTIAVLKNWDLEEKAIEGEKQLIRLEASLGPLQAQAEVAKAEHQRSQEELNRQKAESDFVRGQAQNLKSKTPPPRIASARKELEQVQLQADSLLQKAALHKYLAEQGIFPKQSALQSAYEAASATKQVQALSHQVTAEEAELQERSKEALPKMQEVAEAANANLQRIENVKAEIKATEIQLDSTKKQVNLYKQQLNELTLKSPIDGTILTLKADSIIGQNFNKGDTIAVVGNLDKVKVKIQLPEEERAFVKVGQNVTARFRAVPDSIFKGKVSDVAPVTSETGEQTNKRRIWEITLILLNSNNTLRPGMTGYAKIDTGDLRSLLVLAWDEIYKSFRLDRYIDRNPFAKVDDSANVAL